MSGNLLKPVVEKWHVDGELYELTVDELGEKRYYHYSHNYLIGRDLHREGGPSIESPNGDKCWHLNGEYHREDGPAIELADGLKCWYLNGNLHREDGPAVEYANGTKSWFYNEVNIEKKFNVKITSVEQYKKLIDLLVFE
jgi:hypothetical protein